MMQKCNHHEFKGNHLRLRACGQLRKCPPATNLAVECLASGVGGHANLGTRHEGKLRECFSEQGAQQAKQSRRRRAAKLTFSIVELVMLRCHLWHDMS